MSDYPDNAADMLKAIIILILLIVALVGLVYGLIHYFSTTSSERAEEQSIREVERFYNDPVIRYRIEKGLPLQDP